MTVVVDVLIAAGVVVAGLIGSFIVMAVFSLAFVVLAAIPGVARLGRAFGEWLSVLALFAGVGLLLLLALGPVLMFLGVGIFLIVVGSGMGDSGQVRWGAILGGVILFLLGLVSCLGFFVERKPDSED